MVWLIVGSTGAGKTTYSKNVAKSFGAAVYSIDDWMRALYWQDMPANPSNQWFLENGKWYTDRIARCEEWILRNTLERESLGQNTILDLGFSTADHRIQVIIKLRKQGVRVETHYLEVPADTRWERVQKRNSEKGETFAMVVDRNMFDYIESIFEAPQASEGVEVRIVKVGD